MDNGSDYSYVAHDVGDFNGDGHLDIVMDRLYLNIQLDQAVIAVLLGDGSGRFAMGREIPFFTTCHLWYVMAGDFRGINKRDSILYSLGCPGPPLLYNIITGDGASYASLATDFTWGDFVGAFDFEGNGSVDVMFADADFGRSDLGADIEIYALYQPYKRRQYKTYDWNTVMCTTRHGTAWAADINGDGKLDLLSTTNYYDKLYVLYGKGDGDFDDAVSYRSLPRPKFIVSGDFDGDGIDDVITTQVDSTELSFFKGSHGGLLPVARVVTGLSSPPQAAKTADFDKDGKTDLLLTLTDGSIVVLLNTTP